MSARDTQKKQDSAARRPSGPFHLDTKHRTCFPASVLFDQAIADLAAKEVQTGYSTTYVWMANQLGHFTLGWLPLYLVYALYSLARELPCGTRLPVFCLFFMTLIIAALFKSRISGRSGHVSKGMAPAATFGMIVKIVIAGILTCLFFYLLLYLDSLWRFGPLAAVGLLAATIIARKEIADVRRDLATARKASSANHFPIDAPDLWLDAGTAVLFMWMGVAFGATVLREIVRQHMSWLPLIVFATSAAGTLPIARYWLSRKKCYQMAGMSFIFRLCDFPGGFDEDNAQKIVQFVDLDTSGPMHIILCGPEGCGKTSLLTAIGTEHTFQMGKARFTTLIEFLQIGPLAEEPPAQENRKLWPWREANILLIDDVDAKLADIGLLNPQRVVDAFKIRNIRFSDHPGIHTVWAVGDSSDVEKWKEAIARILEVSTSAIHVINMNPLP